MWNNKPIMDSRYSDILYSDNYEHVKEVHEKLVQLEVDSMLGTQKYAYDTLLLIWASVAILIILFLAYTYIIECKMKDLERELDFIDRKVDYMVGSSPHKAKKYDV